MSIQHGRDCYPAETLFGGSYAESPAKRSHANTRTLREVGKVAFHHTSITLMTPGTPNLRLFILRLTR